MLRTSVFKGAASLQELKPAWQELVDDAPAATPFQTWEWQATWFKHFGGAKKAHIVAFYDGDDLEGVMPMMESRGPWKTLRAMGSGPSDVLQPIARKGRESEVAQELAAYLKNLKGVDVIDLHQLRTGNELAGYFPTAFPQATCLLLDLPPSYEAYLATLSKSLRYDCKRMEKPAFAAAGSKIVDVGPSDVQQGMDWLFETHKMRWRKRGLPGAFIGSKSHAFHREWAALASPKGWLWLSTMSQEGKPIGALYGMAMHGTCYFYQAGFDPAFSALSPGTLLVAHTIKRAIQEGCTLFDFMRGDEPYKRRWKPQRSVVNRRVLIASGGMLGRLGEAWNQAGFKVETKVRARLEGRGLI